MFFKKDLKQFSPNFFIVWFFNQILHYFILFSALVGELAEALGPNFLPILDEPEFGRKKIFCSRFPITLFNLGLAVAKLLANCQLNPYTKSMGEDVSVQNVQKMWKTNFRKNDL
jgi:hypothetical protein